MHSSAVSAPAKVLVAGGYLVLERQYKGLVFALSARMHVHIQSSSTVDFPADNILVRSPQFVAAEWRYRYQKLPGEGGVSVTQLDSSSPSARNAFVEACLNNALTYVSSVAPGNLGPAIVTILADTGYYSQPTEASPAAASVPNSSDFIRFQVPLKDAHKTGLGSSAALVTALTGALLSYYLPKSSYDLSSADGKSRLHNLAQIAHCAAQGKIGSGFDVAAAVHGSCVYTRFSPGILEELGPAGSPSFSRNLRAAVDDQTPSGSPVNGIWDTMILADTLMLPKGIRLLMCDVDCGSETVGMVKKVLTWRKQRPDEADIIWESLAGENAKLQDSLAALVQMQQSEPKMYSDGLKTIAHDFEQSWQHKIWSGEYVKIRKTIFCIRDLLRRMSAQAQVPIEPPPQTELLDACSALPGVLGGVVPGAGGYDAIVLLVVDDDEVLGQLTDFLSLWEGSGTTKVRALDVREERDGVKSEQKDYRPWIS